MAEREVGRPEVRSVPLARWLRRSYLRAAIVPLVFIECTFLAIYWLSGDLTYQRNVDAVELVTEGYLSEIASHEAAQIEVALGKVEGLTSVLASQSATALEEPAVPSRTERARHGFGPGGTFYSKRGDPSKDAASFYTGHTPVGPAEIDKVWRAARLDPLMRHIKEASPLVRQVYYNSWDSYNRIYPYINVLDQYSPGMNIPSYNFYYEADAAHNPRRGPVWTNAYVDPAGGGWMVSSIAPVYSSSRLVGVVGIDVTLDTLLRHILALKMPWQGYGMLVGRDGSILALPPQGKTDLGLANVIGQQNPRAAPLNIMKLDRVNIRKRKDLAPLVAVLRQPGQIGRMKLGGRDLMATSARINGAGLSLIVMAPTSEILSAADGLRQEFQAVGLVMIGILLLFYLGFTIFLCRRSSIMSRQVAAPLRSLEQLMKRIGDGDHDQQADRSGVAELDHVADRLVAMGRRLGAAHRRIMAQQDAVQRAFVVEKQVVQGQRRFINVLSHELRTPLTIIDSCGQILSRQADRLTPEDLTARSGVIRTATDRISAVMDSAASLLRLEEDDIRLNMSLVSLRQLLTQSILTLGTGADRFVAEIDNSEVQLRVDAKQVASALAAVLDNAVKFSAPDETIAVEMRCVGLDCHIRVTDQGTGIDPDELPFVVERFYRGRNSTRISGAGVGLFMARSWIVAHGGDLQIDSSIGAGTTVEITLRNVVEDHHERAAAA